MYTGHSIKEGVVKSLWAKETKTNKEAELKLNLKNKLELQTEGQFSLLKDEHE